MSVVKNANTLGELLDIVEPKSMAVLLEVEKGHTFGDSLKDGLNVDKLDKVLWAIEERTSAFDKIPKMETFLIFHRGIPEDQVQLTPVYAFLDPKVDWAKIRTTDLAIILRLDWKIEVIHLAEGFTIETRSLLDWEHS